MEKAKLNSICDKPKSLVTANSAIFLISTDCVRKPCLPFLSMPIIRGSDSTWIEFIRAQMNKVDKILYSARKFIIIWHHLHSVHREAACLWWWHWANTENHYRNQSSGKVLWPSPIHFLASLLPYCRSIMWIGRERVGIFGSEFPFSQPTWISARQPCSSSRRRRLLWWRKLLKFQPTTMWVPSIGRGKIKLMITVFTQKIALVQGKDLLYTSSLLLFEQFSKCYK